MSHVEHAEMTTALEVLGPIIELLTDPAETGTPYCLIKGTIPPGVSVPLHSHVDAETFYVLSGTAQTLVEVDGTRHWRTVTQGEYVHIPGSVKHAHRNVSTDPVVELVVTTPSIGRFFQEVGRPMTPGARRPAPRRQDLARFAQAAARHGHWLATPEENAALGINLP
jgi:quercetin dioxygenase-like cupin family protein